MANTKSKQKLTFSKLWRSDWFVGLALVVATLFVTLRFEFIERLELSFYDFGITATNKKPSENIVIITVDDTSIANVGRWPWPRETQAKLLEIIESGKPKLIVNTVLYSEPQLDRGLEYVRKMKTALAAETSPSANVTTAIGLAGTAEAELDGDGRMAKVMADGANVATAIVFKQGEQIGNADKPLAPAVAKHLIKATSEFSVQMMRIESEPIELIASKAATIGHLNQRSDIDGSVRSDSLVADYFGQSVGALSLMSAARFLNLNPSDIRADPLAGSVKLGKLSIGTDDFGQFRPHFYKSRDDRSAFPVDLAHDVLTGKIVTSKYAGKLVMFGVTAAGAGQNFPTPASPVTPAVELLAHTTSSLLSEHFVTTPLWARIMPVLLFALVAAYIIGILPRLSAAQGAIVTGIGFVGLLLTEFFFLTTASKWVQLVLPAALLLIGHLGLTTKRFLITEQGKLRSDDESAETNRMMGLAYQGTGRLDESFDRYRRVPLNETHGPAVMDNLYNLALDFERKRQFNKAQAVYEYMHAFDKGYKDLDAKLNRAKNLSETVILGGGAGGAGSTMLLAGGGVEKPMLGRYQVEKELGKGAMGVVYLGKDPKIGRVVAIKTMALSQEFEGEELTDARERFFREAETAGRLQHQNIVTIFDCGEEQELAYIAMEFLKGKDLADFSKQGALLPVDRVASICARVAEALAYAHKQNVVHRDIKPANIMYELDTDTVKVTDFGIARITDSSKTKTGLVLGTPSFMSPEQIAGKKVDGRSDLYSLGVMLFQMLAGVLPFRGDSMAELMYKISNEEAPDIRIIRPEISEALASVVALALSKRPDTRYQTGDVFAQDLRAAMGDAAPAPAVVVFTPASLAAANAVSNANDATVAYSAPKASPAVDNADEKTLVMGAAPVLMVAPVQPDQDKTMVLAPAASQDSEMPYLRTDPNLKPVDFDKTEIIARPAVRPVDPFEKTIITPRREPSGGAR